MSRADRPRVKARSAQTWMPASILLALAIASVIHTLIGFEQTEYLGVPFEPVLPVFIVIAVLEPVAHVVVAGGLLAERSWARIGGFVLAGMGLLLIVPTLATALVVPESVMSAYASPNAALASLVLSVAGVVGYLALVVLLARSWTAAEA